MSFYKLLELAYSLPSFSESEWESKMLSQENQKSLGLRSPKLSKFLLARGVPEKVLQKAMAMKRNKKSYFSACWEEQGDSVHYSSCQALNTGAKWFESHEESLWQEGDALAGKQGWVHLWVVGCPMSENGEGFLARAKVRMVYKEGAIQGAFVDRIYGQQELLDIEELKVLLKKKYGKEVPILRLGGKVKGEVPSSKLGYQDTFKLKEEEYNFSSLKGPFLDALQERLATPLWLRQEYREVLEGKPPKSRKPRPSRKELEFPKKVKAFLGLPKSFRITKVEEKGEVHWEMPQCTLTGSALGWIFQHHNGGWIHKKSNGLFVGDDIPELGFYKPRKIRRKQ